MGRNEGGAPSDVVDEDAVVGVGPGDFAGEEGGREGLGCGRADAEGGAGGGGGSGCACEICESDRKISVAPLERNRRMRTVGRGLTARCEGIMSAALCNGCTRRDLARRRVELCR